MTIGPFRPSCRRRVLHQNSEAAPCSRQTPISGRAGCDGASRERSGGAFDLPNIVSENWEVPTAVDSLGTKASGEPEQSVDLPQR